MCATYIYYRLALNFQPKIQLEFLRFPKVGVLMCGERLKTSLSHNFALCVRIAENKPFALSHVKMEKRGKPLVKLRCNRMQCIVLRKNKKCGGKHILRI